MKVIRVNSSSAALKQVQPKLIGKVIQIPDIFANQNVLPDGILVKSSFKPDCLACMQDLGWTYSGREAFWFNPNVNEDNFNELDTHWGECRKKLKKPSEIVIETDENLFRFAFLTGCFVEYRLFDGIRHPFVHTINDSYGDSHMPDIITMFANDPASSCGWRGPSLEDYWKTSGVQKPLPLYDIELRKISGGYNTKYSQLHLSFPIPVDMKPVGREAEEFYSRDITVAFQLGYYREKIHPILWIDETPQTPNAETIRYMVVSKDMQPLLIKPYYEDI
ncbi:MAG: hypothetical protein WC501_00045 [Candidatus Micrarchaeia archaeon]